MQWKFAWIRAWDEVWAADRLAAWRVAHSPDANARATPFTHPDIVRAWVNAAGAERHMPFFLEARHSDGRVARLHMVRPRPRAGDAWVRRLVPVGARVFDYHDPLVTAPPGVEPRLDRGFWVALRAELERRSGRWFDVVHIPRLRGECSLDGAKGKTVDVAPWVSFGPYEDFDAFFAARSGNLRSMIRRAERKLAAGGALAFNVHGPDDIAAVQGWLPRLIETKSAKFGEGFDATFFAAFLPELVRLGVPAGVVHCSSTTLDGEAINWEVDFWLGGVFYKYMFASDPAHARVSLGNLHTGWTIDWALRHGARAYDFMRGAEKYKYSWTDGAEHRMHGFKLAGRAPCGLLRRAVSHGLSRLAARG